jgi:hypothetical protein
MAAREDRLRGHHQVLSVADAGHPAVLTAGRAGLPSRERGSYS